MLPATTSRVAEQTPEYINERIRRETDERVAHYSTLGSEAIQRRLLELDHEWDIERALEVSASTVSLLGLGLGTFVRRAWFILPAVVAAFLLQHALHGWCPPVPLLRRLGVRTSTEIEHERYALKVLRGDFKDVENETPNVGAIVNKTLESVRA
jgi:hypothetical protein